MSSEAPAGSPASNQSTARGYARGDKSFLSLIAVVIALAMLSLAVVGHGLRVVCFDDSAAHAGWFDPAVDSSNLLLDYSAGRFYAPFKFAVLGWLLGEASPLVHTCVRIAALAIGAAGAAWFCARWMDRPRDVLVAGGLVLACFPFYEGYQAFFSNPLLFLGLGAMCGSAALQDSRGPGARALSLVLLALALLCHELFVLFFVLHVAAEARAAGGPSAGIFRRLLPGGILIAAYVALNLALKSRALIDYEGVRLSTDPVAALHSVIRYTVSAWPGFEIWFDRAAPGALPARSPGDAFALLVDNLDPLSLVLAAGAALLAHHQLGRAPAKPARALGLTVLLFGALTVLPNLLPALTEKYQIWAMQRRLPYYYGALGLVFGACGLLVAARRICGASRLARAGFAAGIGLATLATQTMNREVAHRLKLRPVDTSALSP